MKNEEVENQILEEKNTKRDKTTLILIVLSIATVLVTIVGTTFAFFTITVQGNSTSSSVIVKTATIGISYDGGNEVFAEYIKPGETIPNKTFTVQNTGNSSITYSIKWVNVTNDFAVPSELQYQITGSATGGGSATNVSLRQAPTTNGYAATGIIINANATHTYVLQMSFPNTGSEQNANQGKTFMGKIEIELQ